jgi:hypothetical protein
VGPNWETLIERQIREAMAEGKFDNLPHRGQPLPTTDNPYAGEQALAFSILRNYGAAPPWIEADKEVRELLTQRDAIFDRVRRGGRPPTTIAQRRDRAALHDLVGRINAAIARVNAEAPTYRVHRRPLVLADELAHYDEACRGT